MDTTTETPPPPPAPKQKRHKRAYRKRAAAPKAQPALKIPAEFAGMDTTSCCTACGPKGCIISGDMCVHPMKGGLQTSHMTRPDVVARYGRAKKAMAQAKLDLTYG